MDKETLKTAGAPTSSNDIENASSSDDKHLERKRSRVRSIAHGASSFWVGFYKFISNGNIIDLAIGIIIGNAFTLVVNSFVNDILTPPLGLLTSSPLDQAFVLMRSGQSGSTTYPSLTAAQDDGAVTWNYGHFIQTCINFLIICLAIYLMVLGKSI